MKTILRTTALLLVLFASSSRAQVETEDGDELCSCSPTVFRFTLDFAATCPGNLENGDGIENVDCQTLVLGSDQSDTTPVLVDTFTILELNDDQVINSTTLAGPFVDGDEIEYASISSYRNLTDSYFPVGLEMTLIGENSNQETVVNIISIRYDTSECNEWPVIPSDTMIGWVDFATVEDALRIYCPEAPATADTDAPTDVPTVSPTEAPIETIIPTTLLPVATPSVAPADTTIPTTVSPVEAPSVAPVETIIPTTSLPVEAPSVAPAETIIPTTFLPVATPSVAPADTTIPTTTSPVEAPSDSPVATVIPTSTAPVETPSVAPMTDQPALTPSNSPTLDQPVTPPPALVPGPTLAPSPAAQPTPDEPPEPLPPIMFPAIDSPTVDLPDLPPSQSEDE